MAHFAKNLAATFVVATCASAGQAEAATLMKLKDEQNFLEADAVKKLNETFLSADELKEVKTAEDTKSSLLYKYAHQQRLLKMLNSILADELPPTATDSKLVQAAKSGDLQALAAMGALQQDLASLPEKAFTKFDKLKEVDAAKADSIDSIQSELASAYLWTVVESMSDFEPENGKTLKEFFAAKKKAMESGYAAAMKTLDEAEPKPGNLKEQKESNNQERSKQLKQFEDAESLFNQINSGSAAKDVKAFFAKTSIILEYIPDAKAAVSKQEALIKAADEVLKKDPENAVAKQQKADAEKMLKVWNGHLKYLESQVSSGMSMMMWTLIILAILVVVGVICFFIFKKDSDNQELPTHEGDLDSEEEEELTK